MSQLVALFAEWSGLSPAAVDMLAGWDAHAYSRRGTVCAVALTCGTEIHFAIAPGQRHSLLQRSRTREFLRPLIARRGYLTTRADHADANAGDFLTRLGFMKTWGDEQFDHYMLSALPFSREH